ncbi:UDP-3-O-(3-hydroxymyristoyl)glucosamine N-acyltransferase [Arcobacter sp. 31_11_sub10_T18]|nr:UDP-3-O-(3-hydroxymyristoyl)glucosamine N-acyltransferase [Arcobacter sp. 31_11_sub10_T18]
MNLQDIVENLGLSDVNQLKTVNISGLNTLADANQSEISFLDNKKYLKDLESTKAAAVLIKEEFASLVPKSTLALITDEPYLKLALASEIFAPSLIEEYGKDPIIGENTVIMPNVYLGKNVTIGKDSTIMAGSYISDNVIIGSDTIVHPNVVVYRDCKIGNSCIIHAGTIIGSDGFGFAHTKKGEHVKIYQNGNVLIEDNVEIGSNTTIDRAVFGSTIIKNGVKLDNQVQIAHNCVLGEHTIITAQVGLSGSSILGRNVVMGGQSATAGHLEIAPFTTIAARGGVTKSITEGGKTWAGFPLFEHRPWLKLQGKIAKLLK